MSMSISEVQRFRDLRLRIEALESKVTVLSQLLDNVVNVPKPRTKTAKQAGIRL